MCTDIEKVHFRASNMNEQLVSEMILKHMYQNGCFSAAELYSKQIKVEIDPAFASIFQEMYDVLNAFENHDLKPAIE